MLQRVFWLLLIAFWARTTSAQELVFEAYPPTKGTSVEFSMSDGGTVPLDAIGALPLRTESTQDHRYRVSVDTQTFGLDKFQRCSFDAYVYPEHSSERKAHKYIVSEDPIGAFLDVVTTIHFHVKGEAGEDAGTIKLPVHSKDGSDNLKLVLPDDPLRVGSGAKSSSELGLNNQLENLHVRLLEAHIRSTTCPDCWMSLSATANLDTLAPQKGTSLLVERRPDTFKALAKSMFVLNPKVAHDVLVISLSSVSEQGGLPAPQEFNLPVRFAPPGPYLALTVVLGAVAGSLLRLWVKETPASAPVARQGFRRLGQMGFTAIIAVVVWVVALVLFSYTDTQVKIFSFTLDPSQLPPAFLIALLAAGGPPIVKKIKEALGN